MPCALKIYPAFGIKRGAERIILDAVFALRENIIQTRCYLHVIFEQGANRYNFIRKALQDPLDLSLLCKSQFSDLVVCFNDAHRLNEECLSG